MAWGNQLSLVDPSHVTITSIVVMKDVGMDVEARITAWLAQQDVDVYLVGGCIRDRLLHRDVADLDVTTAGDGLLLARRLC